MDGLVFFEAVCGIVQCVFMSAIIVNLTDKRRFSNDIKSYIISILCLGIAGTYNTLAALIVTNQTLQITTTVLTFLMFIVAIGVISRDSIGKKIKLFLLTALVPSIAIEIPLEIYVTIVSPGGLSIGEVADHIVYRNFLRMMSMSICICYSTCLILFHNRRKFKNTLMSIALLILIPLIQLVYLTIVFKPELSTKEIPAAIAGGIALLFSAFVNILFLRLISISKAIYEKENEQRLAITLDSMNKQYMDIVQEETDRTLKIKHDIGNQLEQIRFLVNNGNSKEAKEMLSELKNKTDSLMRIKYSNNEIVNTILTLKGNEAEREQIKFNTNIRISKDLNIRALDLSSALSNLLDNAIKETKSCRDKYINISMLINNDKLVIRVDNKVSEDTNQIKIEKGYNKEAHGHGLRILDDIARRNNGEFFIEIKEGVCTSIITLSV